MKKYKVGVIGLGFIGIAHIDALRRVDNVEVVAISDVLGAQQQAERLGIEKAYDDYKKMIDTEKPDAVHICTPNHTHYEISMYAIERGIHVICEKPFMHSVEEAQAVCEAAKARGVSNAVNFHNRFYPMPNHLRNLIRDGELGDVISVHGGYVQDWLLYDTDFNWRLLSSHSGKTRAVADIGSHWLDLVEFVTGRKITDVCAEFSTVYPVRYQQQSDGSSKPFDIDTEDTAMLLLRFDNGAVGSAVVTGMLAGKKNKTTVIVGGKKMSAEWDSEAIGDLWLGRRKEGNMVVTKDPNLLHPETKQFAAYPGGHVEGFPDAFRQHFKHFYSTIDTPQEKQYATFEDGLRDMVLCEKIYESAKSGKWVKI